MIVRANVMFLGCKQESFKGKNGDNIQFQRVCFMPEYGDEPMKLTALNSLDFSNIDKCADLVLEFDFSTDQRTGYLKGKIVGIE